MEKLVCDICGRELKPSNRVRYYGQTLCQKHYRQIKKYGKALDNNPRTTLDKNDIIIQDGYALITLYNKSCDIIAHAYIDIEDIPKVKYIKWKLSNSGYVMNAPKFRGGCTHLSHVVLGLDNSVFVDHINGDRLDNRKSNLRVVTKSQNQMNVNYRGVSNRENGRFYAYIKLNQHLYNLGEYLSEAEALYARWYAETLLFGEYRYKKEEPDLPDFRKVEIQDYVNKKVQRL